MEREARREPRDDVDRLPISLREKWLRAAVAALCLSSLPKRPFADGGLRATVRNNCPVLYLARPVGYRYGSIAVHLVSI
jgi:hypothetical protein